MPSWAWWIVGIVICAVVLTGGAALAHHEIGWSWPVSFAASPLVVAVVLVGLWIWAKLS